MIDRAGLDLSIVRLQAKYRAGDLTPESVVAAIYDRMEEQSSNPMWISVVSRESALAAARNLPKEVSLPLYGIPFAVKDNIDAVGMATTAGCPAFSNMPERSAFVVDRLLKAGAILIGKTNMDQFATGLVGTRSPYGACASVFDSRYISGGSSSGSAVAVASGMVSFALGTDTAGSGRVPAAFNNIIGLKPSRGLLSATGVVPACRSLDCVSIFALSCSDAYKVFGAARAPDDEDPYSRMALAPEHHWQAPIRVGIPVREQLQFFGNSEYERLYDETIELLQRNGATIIEIDYSLFQETAELLYSGPFVAERLAAVGDFVKAHREEVNDTVGAIILNAARFTAAETFSAQHRLQALQKKAARQFAEIDVLLLPTSPTTYTIEEVNGEPLKLNSNLGYYTNFVNLLDLCAVAVPAGFTKSGLPFGVTAVSQTFRETALLEFADEIHRAHVRFAGKQVSALPDQPLRNPKAVREGGEWVRLGVIGAHLSGQPLNHQLTERGARLLRTTRTASDYRMFALTNTVPPKPGLIRTPGLEGPGIEIEIWEMPQDRFGSFVAAVPPPLSIGSCLLQDGELVKGFLCEPYATAGMPDITETGAWRRYLAK